MTELRVALCKGPNRAGVSLSSIEDWIGSSFWNVAFSTYLERRTMDKVHKFCDFECYDSAWWAVDLHIDIRSAVCNPSQVRTPLRTQWDYQYMFLLPGERHGSESHQLRRSPYCSQSPVFAVLTNGHFDDSFRLKSHQKLIPVYYCCARIF
jgi:hypothetical protein